MVRQGVKQGGDPTVILTHELGEDVMMLGVALVDFPIMPALQLCMNFGDRAHLNVAHELVNQGADLNSYRIPMFPEDFGYGPAILYTLGLGFIPPNTQHGAMLQRLYATFTAKFNMTAVQDFIEATGNPPLTHIPTLFGFSDGLFILLSDLGQDVNERDSHGLTPLHVAAWRGDAMTVALLLSHDADRSLTDKHGRMPLHYAAMRGFGEIIDLLFIVPVSIDPRSGRRKEMGAALWTKLKRSMLTAEDKDKRTALMLAALTPSIPVSVRAVRKKMTAEKQLPNARWSRAPLKAKRNKEMQSHEHDKLEDEPGFVGGWSVQREHRLEKKDGGEDEDEKSDIDVVQANTISKGVFKRDYYSAQRPVLFSGQLTAGEPIWANWRRKDLVARYGDLELRSGEVLHHPRDQFGIDPRERSRAGLTTLRAWVEAYASGGIGSACDAGSDQGTCSISGGGGAEAWMALNDEASSSLPAGANLREDLHKPKVLQMCESNDGREEELKFSIGVAGSGAPIHAHNASWNVLLFGRKRWYFVPPSINASEPGVLTKNLPGLLGSVQPTAQWVAEHAPSLRSKGLLFEVTQFPGEVVFVPHDWHHATLNLLDSASLSQEICTLRHTDVRVQPLGPVVYGSNDSTRGLGRTKHLYQDLQHFSLRKLVGPTSDLPAFH